MTLDSFEDNKTAVQAEIEELTSGRESAEAELSAATKVSTQFEIELNKQRSEESDLKGRIEKAEDTLDGRKKESTQLNSEIAVNQGTLKQLKQNINLFPSEISGYVSQGAKSIAQYMLLAIIPMVVLVVVVVILFSNAVNLTTVYHTEGNIELWTMFLSRLPFVTVAVFVIHASYKITKVFIAEIMKINTQRLNLSKVRGGLRKLDTRLSGLAARQ